MKLRNVLNVEPEHMIQTRQKKSSNMNMNLSFLLNFFQVLVQFSDVFLDPLAELGDVLISIGKGLVNCIKRIVNAWSQGLKTEQQLKKTSA